MNSLFMLSQRISFTKIDSSTTLINYYFNNTINFLLLGDLLVFNDTYVLKIRFLYKKTGRKVKILIELILNIYTMLVQIHFFKLLLLNTH